MKIGLIMNKFLKVSSFKFKSFRRLFIILICLFFFYFAQKVLANNFTWDFLTGSDYVYDSSKITITNGKAELSSPVNWYNQSWLYRKPITLNNTSSADTLTNYQVAINLNSTNFDFSKAKAYGEDIRITSGDGVTEIPFHIEYFNQMTMDRQTIVNYDSHASPAGWWHFNSSTADSSGNGNTFALNGNAGYINSSLSLDGAGDYASVVDSNSLDFPSSFTIETWLRINVLPGTPTSDYIIAKGGTTDGEGNDHNFYLTVANKDSAVGVSDGYGFVFGFEDSLGNNYQVSENVQPEINRWYHLAGVFDDTNNTLTLYRDGKIVGVKTGITATPSTNNQPLTIGSRNTISDFVDGRIDEVRLYGSVLSSETILADYNKTAEGGKIVANIPSIPGNSEETIYLYYGQNSTENLKLGLVTDIHGITDSGTKYGTQAAPYLTDFVNYMNSTYQPNLVFELGDKINDSSHDTDIASLNTLRAIFDNLTADHYFTLGNHDTDNISKAEFQTALEIDYTHKSFDYGDYHFTILDTNDPGFSTSGNLSSSEITWLTNDLAASNKKKIVISHQALDGQPDNLNKYFSANHLSNLNNASTVRSILENDGGVVAVLNGHTHLNHTSIINNILYLSLGSLTEEYSKTWGELEILDNQYLVYRVKQDNHPSKTLIWDMVNHQEYNNPSETYNLYDDFSGDSGQWSEPTGLNGGNWSITTTGILQDTGTSAQQKILKSNYAESVNYVAEAYISLYSSEAFKFAGFASKVLNSSNFDAVYIVDDDNDDVRWKQMDAGSWQLIGQQASFTPDTYWHHFKMKKIGDRRIVYLDNVEQFDLTNSDLDDNYFGLWTYQFGVQFDDLKVTSYAAVEPTVSVGTEVVPFSNDNPSILPMDSISFNSISAFTESATKNNGEIKYQVSNDGGTSWFWYHSGWTETTSGYTEANTAAEINSNISSFPQGDGSFLFKAYFHSDGTNLVSLDTIDLTYTNDSLGPTGGSISYTDGYTTVASVNLSVLDGTDSSGIDTSSRIVQRNSAVLSGGNCGTYTDFSTITVTGSYPTFTDSSVSSGYCYQYRYLVSDINDNQTTYVSSSTIKVDTGIPGTPGTPSTTTPTGSTSQTWTWQSAIDTISGIANYVWRTTGSIITSGTTSIASLTTNFTDGIYNFFVKAFDNAGNESLESLAVTLIVDTQAPNITSVSSETITANTVAINWNTNEDASSQVEYGLTENYGKSTTETDKSPRVKNHTVNLADLVSCSIYHYRVKSNDSLSHEGVSSDNVFTTTGCLGSATVDSQYSGLITSLSGGTAALVDSGAGINLAVPAAFNEEDAYIQIKKLNKATVLETTDVPAGYSAAGPHIYDLKALTDTSVSVGNFDQDIEMTISYSSSDVSDIDENSLWIYTWNGSEWDELSDCQVNSNANTITCSTAHFTVFGLFGEPSQAEESKIITSTSSVDSYPTNSPPVCTDSLPGAKVPWLYGASAQNSSSILIYFTAADEPVGKYVLEYGTKSGEYPYGSQNLCVNSRGQMTYLVGSLSPNTTYYFRVRAGNGCAVGEWSNEISAKTFGVVDTNNLVITTSNIEPLPTKTVSQPQPEPENKIEKYSLSVKVQDENNRPIESAQVTLHSEVRTTHTDKNGIAKFVDVEAGNHEVIVSYDGYEGKENINLTADSPVKEINLNITIRKQETFFSPIIKTIIVVLITVLLFGVVLFLIKKRNSKNS